MKTFKQQCIELRKQDFTLNEIVKITSRPKTSVYFYIKDINLSRKKKKEIALNSKRCITEFNIKRRGKSSLNRNCIHFSIWTKTLVLLVAHLLFDGQITHSSCVYTNRSRVLIERVKKSMKIIYNYDPKHIESTPSVYRISYYNVELAAYIKEKSDELLKTIPSMNIELKRAFLQSFFDDEGSVYFIQKKRLVRGYQHSLKILLLIQVLLNDFNIESVIDKKYYEIAISRKENLEKFAQEINFSHGVRVNGNRSNSIWKQSLEKREILYRALNSYQAN